jgi:hypothetical protein
MIQSTPKTQARSFYSGKIIPTEPASAINIATWLLAKRSHQATHDWRKYWTVQLLPTPDEAELSFRTSGNKGLVPIFTLFPGIAPPFLTVGHSYCSYLDYDYIDFKTRLPWNTNKARGKESWIHSLRGEDIEMAGPETNIDRGKSLLLKDQGNKCFQAGDYAGAEALYTKAYVSRNSFLRSLGAQLTRGM